MSCFLLTQDIIEKFKSEISNFLDIIYMYENPYGFSNLFCKYIGFQQFIFIEPHIFLL